MERWKFCDIHRVRENRGPPGSPDRDVSGVIIQFGQRERIVDREVQMGFAGIVGRKIEGITSSGAFKV